MAQIGFNFATPTAEALFALTCVIGQAGARLRAQSAVVTRFPLARTGSPTVVHIGRIDNGIDEIQFHALHLKLLISREDSKLLIDDQIGNLSRTVASHYLRETSVERVGDVHARIETDVLTIPSANEEASVQI